MIEFVFMLTHGDVTVPNAREVLDAVSGSGLRYVGFKDVGATPARQRELTAAAHEAGLEVMLEVVSTSEAAELDSLRAALDANVDWVLGGTHADAGLGILAGSSVHYCPFPGRVIGHPSVLHGGIDEIAADAKALTSRPGVYGVDLLAYRHADEDPVELTRAVAQAIDGPVVAAGSVTTAEQIRDLARAGAWGFTIGSAIFDGLLPGAPDVAAQVREALNFAEAV